MPKTMPTLNHKGEKLEMGKSFWSIPQDITIYAFKHLTYSETQLLIYLMGNKPANQEEGYDGWKLSNINDCLSGNDSTIRAARRSLAELGFITQTCSKENSSYSTITVNFDWIRKVAENDWDKKTIKEILSR